jgi:nucleobase:cation symporter-1, NCS1 family
MAPSLGKAKAALLQKKANAAKGFTSWQNFKAWIMVPDTALDKAGNSGSRITWSNVDLDPTPPERRTWRWYNCKNAIISRHNLNINENLTDFIFYWTIGFGNWTLGSTMIGIGLNWWQSILTIFLSQFISSIAVRFLFRYKT